MGLSREHIVCIIIIIAMAMFGESLASSSVHKVGGSAGWTTLGNVDYQKWTSSDIFTAGDSLCNFPFSSYLDSNMMFYLYNTHFHNVKQVSRRDFLSCNATLAVATYNSGSDTVALKTPGHYYFLCGFPGHCQAGQKLHVLVVATTSGPSLSPDPSSSSPSTGSSPSPATASEDSAQNGAISCSVSLSTAMSGIVVFLVALIVLY